MISAIACGYETSDRCGGRNSSKREVRTLEKIGTDAAVGMTLYKNRVS